MLRFLVALLVLICLAASPVLAATCDLGAADGKFAVALKADPGNAATDGDSESPAGHHCCTAHAHFGTFERSAFQIARPSHANDRLPIAELFEPGIGHVFGKEPYRSQIEAEITLRLPVNLARQIQRRIAVASGRVKLQGRALQSYKRAAA